MIAVALSGVAHAQTLYQSGTELERRAFASTTTYVQLLGDPDYDKRLRDALSANWTLTRGIEFIDPGEPLGDAGDERRSYISIWRLHDYGSRSFLVLWQGGKVWGKENGSTGGYTNTEYWNSWVVAVPIDCIGRETKDEFVAWRLPLAVRSIVQLAEHAKREDPDVARLGLPAGKVKDLRPSILSGKSLLLWKGRFTDDQISLIREHYPHKTEVVEMDVILEAIDQQDPHYAVLVLAQAGGHTTLSAHDTATGNLLFSEHRHQPMKDYELPIQLVKGLGKAVGK